jgi:hydrogenase-4 component F
MIELLALVLVPLAGAVAGFLLSSRNARMAVLVACAFAHLGLVLHHWSSGASGAILGGWFSLDPLGLLFLAVVSVAFAATSVYEVSYRHLRPPRTSRTFLVPLELVLLATMTLLAMTRHLGFLWVTSGAMTLAVSPLIYLQRDQRTLEAAWKYLILCSVGVALALLGIFLLAIAATDPSGAPRGFILDDLLVRAREHRLALPWLRTAFIFMLVGFGTKVGLAPMHTWKPDTYSEAPTPVAALMATAMCNCAFLCVLRGYQVCVAAGEGEFAGRLLVVLGLVSIATATAFVVGQADAKRLLAYSGVEHMGVLALGVGAGGKAVYGAMLHLVGHSFAKAALFFAVGNMAFAYQTRSIPLVSGAFRRVPVSGVLLMAGFLATLGFPPFSIFVSELTILRGALEGHHDVAAALYLALLATVSVAVLALVQGMVQGEAPQGPAAPREPLALTAPGIVLLLATFAIGLHVPAALDDALLEAARLLGG